MAKQFSDYVTDEGYTPEAQAIIDDWEKRISDDPGMFAQLVLMHDVDERNLIRLQAENKQLKAQLAAVQDYAHYCIHWNMVTRPGAMMGFEQWYKAGKPA